MNIPLLPLMLAAAASVALAADPVPLTGLPSPAQRVRLDGDLLAVQSHRAGLRSVVRFVEDRPDLFPAGPLLQSRLLSREGKEQVWNTWQRFLDYVVACESLAGYHRDFLRLGGAAREDSFLVGHAALLAPYRAALEFITRAQNDPELDKILNEPVPEIGLPAGTYDRLKFRYLNVAIATEFAAREAVLATFTAGRQPALRAALREDAAAIWKAGLGPGEALTVQNGFAILRKTGQAAWLPVQTGVAEWMGDTRVYRPGLSLVSAAQIEQLQPRLEPGDILLERREWFLSNIGLPGFWPHAALYIGTPEERRRYFDDPGVRAWVAAQGRADGNLEALLQARELAAWENSRKPQEGGHVPRVIEAMSEGVLFTTLEHSAACDSLAVLRPRLPKAGKAQALLRAFHFAGRPYDFEFDFATDAALVCTEVVCKAYEPATGYTGLRFPLVEVLGRQVTPANLMAKQFDVEHGTSGQQVDLVLFLDGHEKEQRAVEAPLAEFRASWRRPKWHVLVQPPTAP